MNEVKAKTECTLHAVVIRADGTREDLGMIASTKKLDRVKMWIKEKMR